MRRIAPLIFGLGVLALWWVVAETGAIESYFLPHPLKVFETLVLGLTEGDLLRATGVTMVSAGLGCVIAAILGIPFGYAIAKNRVISATFSPYLAASQAIPAVALAPLLVVWIGYGLPSITVLCVILVIFPVIISTALGIRELDPDVIDAARLDGAGRWDLMKNIELPLAAPSILAGIRTGFTLSITGAVVGEMVMGGSGLGAALARSQGSTANATHLFAVIAILVVLAVGIYLLLSFIENAADNRKGSS